MLGLPKSWKMGKDSSWVLKRQLPCLRAGSGLAVNVFVPAVVCTSMVWLPHISGMFSESFLRKELIWRIACAVRQSLCCETKWHIVENFIAEIFLDASLLGDGSKTIILTVRRQLFHFALFCSQYDIAVGLLSEREEATHKVKVQILHHIFECRYWIYSLL